MDRRRFLKGAAVVGCTATIAVPGISFAENEGLEDVEFYGEKEFGCSFFPVYSEDGSLTFGGCMIPMVRHGDGFLLMRYDVKELHLGTAREEFIAKTRRDAAKAILAAVKRGDRPREIDDEGKIPEAGVLVLLRPRKA